MKSTIKMVEVPYIQLIKILNDENIETNYAIRVIN